MNKREYCESRESIAYYSGLNVPELAWFNVRRDGVPGTMIIKALVRP